MLVVCVLCGVCVCVWDVECCLFWVKRMDKGFVIFVVWGGMGGGGVWLVCLDLVGVGGMGCWDGLVWDVLGFGVRSLENGYGFEGGCVKLGLREDDCGGMVFCLVFVFVMNVWSSNFFLGF